VQIIVSAGGCFRGRLGILEGLLFIHFRQFQHEIFNYIKEDMGIVSENFEDVSLDMVAVLLWEQQLFPNLME